MDSLKNHALLRATVIGDVVGSRRAADRSALHRRTATALQQVADGSIDAPAFTVGDEFQGSYPTVGAAIDAAMRVRLLLAPEVDVRFGIGWGAITILDSDAGIQDGPAWWQRETPSGIPPTSSSGPALRWCGPHFGRRITPALMSRRSTRP